MCVTELYLCAQLAFKKVKRFYNFGGFELDL